MEFARFDNCTNARLTLSSVLTEGHVHLHIRKGPYKKKNYLKCIVFLFSLKCQKISYQDVIVKDASRSTGLLKILNKL